MGQKFKIDGVVQLDLRGQKQDGSNPIAEEFLFNDIDFEVTTLEVGDIHYRNTWIEVKEPEDFQQSITNRMFSQALRLAEKPRPYIFIAGNPFKYYHSRINLDAVKGGYTSLMCRYGINMCIFQDMEELVEMAIRTIIKDNDGKTQQTLLDRSHITDHKVRERDKAAAVIAKVPCGIGFKKAKPLLKNKTLLETFQMDIEELKCYPGIGDKIATDFYKFLRKVWKQ